MKTAIRGARSRLGFTLIELMIVILIIGILLAMIFPVVNSVMEEARQTSCQNNLRQIGIALQNHRTTRGGFPKNEVGGSESEEGDCEGGYYSWLAYLLPSLGQEELYGSIDFSESMADNCDESASDGSIGEDHVNALAAARDIPLLRCPSDDAAGSNAAVMGTADPASDSYVGNAGWPSNATGYSGERKTPAQHNGVIALVHPRANIPWMAKRGVRSRLIRDGESNTAAVSERLIQQGNTISEIRESDIRIQSFHITDSERTLSQMADRCDESETHSDPGESAYIGRSWISGWSRTGPTYMHVKTPNTINCHFGGDETGDRLITPSSNHRGGVNLLMAGGSVHFVNDEIDRKIWWAIGSRDGRERETLVD